MAGDRYDLSAISWYKYVGQGLENQVDPSIPISFIFNEILSKVAAHSIWNTGTHFGGGYSNIDPILYPGLQTFLDTQGNDYQQNGANQKPKAYLNWMLFDEQFKPVKGSDGSGFEAVGSSEEYKQHVFLNLPVVKSGYLYVWVSSETENVNVFFDNLTVVHRTGPLLQEDDYYPFGLEMKMLGSKAAGKQENKLKYNGGKELQSGEFADGSGLELYDAHHRFYDPQIGRFGQVDPWACVSPAQGGFNMCDNNPILYVDPSGLTPGFANDSLHRAASLPGVIVTPKGNRAAPSPANGTPQAGDGNIWQDGKPGKQNSKGNDPNAPLNQERQEGATNAPEDSKGGNTEPGGEQKDGINGLIGIRRPDYVNFNVSLSLKGAIGWNISVSLDRYGKIYMSPIGVSLGKSPARHPLTAATTLNWLDGSKPSEAKLQSFLSGHGFNASGGFWAGGSVTYSPGNGVAYGGGFVSPQIGVSYNYTPDVFIFKTSTKW